VKSKEWGGQRRDAGSDSIPCWMTIKLLHCVMSVLCWYLPLFLELGQLLGCVSMLLLIVNGGVMYLREALTLDNLLKKVYIIHFFSTYILMGGSFATYNHITIGTRETAFLSAILSAGIVEKVAQARLARTWCNETKEDAVYPMNYDSDIDYAIKFVETFTNPNDAAVTSGGTISSNYNIRVVTTTTSDITNPFGGTPDGISSGDDGITSHEINSGVIYSNVPAIKLMELHNNRVGREVSYNTSISFLIHLLNLQ